MDCANTFSPLICCLLGLLVEVWVGEDISSSPELEIFGVLSPKINAPVASGRGEGEEDMLVKTNVIRTA